MQYPMTNIVWHSRHRQQYIFFSGHAFSKILDSHFTFDAFILVIQVTGIWIYQQTLIEVSTTSITNGCVDMNAVIPFFFI